MTLNQDYVTPPTPARNGHDKVSNGYDWSEPVMPRPRRDRDPKIILAKRVAQAKRRRAKAIEQGRKLFNCRTLSTERTEARLRQAHALYEQYVGASVTSLRLELLD